MDRLIRSLEPLRAELQQGAVTIGNFDGVHVGHRQLVAQLRAVADRVGGPAVVLTFDPPPVALLRPQLRPPALTWMERRAELLLGMGADWVVAYPTDLELLGLTPEAFFERVLQEQLRAKAVLEGPNFRFGRGRAGDTRRLEQLCRAAGMQFSLALGESHAGELVSSTRIRQLLGEGMLVEANRLLGAPYRLRGEVATGDGRGRQLGFPTANLVSVPVLIPGEGVYAGRCRWEGGAWYPAAVHVGSNPTFGQSVAKLEVHLIGVERDLYGSSLEVELLEPVRGVERFEGPEQLCRQLRRDIEQVERVAGGLGPSG